jgi:hypothetical protein
VWTLSGRARGTCRQRGALPSFPRKSTGTRRYREDQDHRSHRYHVRSRRSTEEPTVDMSALRSTRRQARYLQGVFVKTKWPVNPDSIPSRDCNFPRSFVKHDGFQWFFVVIVDGLNQGVRVGEDGEGIACYVGLGRSKARVSRGQLCPLGSLPPSFPALQAQG